MNKWYVILGVTAIVALIFLFKAGPSVINSNQMVKPSPQANQSKPSAQSQNNKVPSQAYIEANPAVKSSGNAHLDQLSPEMKQSIRDTLLLHGPMEVIHNSDGSFELPSNGRFTQMPVAVQMPDGSIQIKEYSFIPEDK